MNGLRKRKKLKTFNFLRLRKPSSQFRTLSQLNSPPCARKIYAAVEINLYSPTGFV